MEPEQSQPPPAPLPLEPVVQHYDWGDRERIPRLLGVAPEGKPWAELWFGAHPSAPSRVRIGGAEPPLDEFLARAGAGNVLGREAARRFGGIPFLLKVLFAAEPLSIQAHPSRKQAIAGFEDEERRGIALRAATRNYRDRNHKPELLVARIDTWALCGFRPLEEIAALLVATPELAREAGSFVPTPQGLRELLGEFLRRDEDAVDRSLRPLLERLAREHAARPFPRDDHRYWLVRADRRFRRDGKRDAGLFAMLLLNLVHLAPGEGIFIEAGTLHAYLEGGGVEIMASSDNVLRGGLTSKHVDVPELLRVVRFEPSAPRLVHAEAIAPGERRYRTPAEEFELSAIELAPGRPWRGRARGGEIFLVLELADGSSLCVATAGEAGVEPLALRRGQACFVAGEAELALESEARATVFRATIPATRADAGGGDGDRREHEFVEAIRSNIDLTRDLFARGETPEVIGTVSGSAAAQGFWQRQLDVVRDAFRARAAVSFHEDLPVNQAFGILLLWQRLRQHLHGERGALVAFVFGEGTRATPFTETESAQKPAIKTFVAEKSPAGTRYLSMVELALRYFVPVEQYLCRSGFDGIVVKWGDEIQIPTRDLRARDALFAGADVVRFVSVQAMDDDAARNKDWVGVSSDGRVTAFIPRRPLAEMERLADRGLLERRDGRLLGGINLGSIGLSRVLLDALLDEFRDEVNDPSADRERRPDLDPQFFTALTIAALDGAEERRAAWRTSLEESVAMARLAEDFPRVLERLRGVLGRFERRHGRRIKMVAMDFGGQYWGDIGQHARIFEFYMALNETGARGEISRALAGIDAERDARGNILVGETSLSEDVEVRDSVLVDVTIAGNGQVENCVLIGTHAGSIRAEDAFEFGSTVSELVLEPRAGTYRVVTAEALHAGRGERWTTLLLAEGPLQLRVEESTDLRDRAATYDVPILGNPISFREAHERMGRVRAAELEARRAELERAVRGKVAATR